MKLATVEFVGQSRQDVDNRGADPSRLLNLFREPSSDRTRHVLKSVLGTATFAETSGVFMRAMKEVSGTIYAVAGGSLYSVSSTGVVTTLGSVTDSTDTSISGNNGKVTIAAGGNYYVWDGSTLSTPAAGAFSDFGGVEFLGQYTVLTEQGGRRVQWSDAADPTTLGALNFATAESTDDNCVRPVAVSGNLWIFKEQSIEIWYPTGGTDVFAPLSGGTREIGLKAYRLVSKFPNGAFFVGSDGIVYVTNGSNIQPISTTAVESAIEAGGATQAFYYEDEGHKFCVLRFSNRPAWCYDISTGEWHERGEGVNHDAWPMVATVNAYGNWYAGSDLGSIYKLTRNNVDVSGPLMRRAISRTLFDSGRRFRVNLLELYANMGENSLQASVPVYVTDEDGLPIVDEYGYYIALGTTIAEIPLQAQLWIRVSRDHGNTWGPQKSRNFGTLGDYGNRAVWRNMGRFRFMNVEFSCSAQADLQFYSSSRVELS